MEKDKKAMERRQKQERKVQSGRGKIGTFSLNSEIERREDSQNSGRSNDRHSIEGHLPPTGSQKHEGNKSTSLQVSGRLVVLFIP